MSRPGSIPRVRGKVYPSQQAAADDLGVSPSAIWCAIERGTTDHVGLGHAHVSVQVWVNGVHYPSQQAADRALGLKKRAVASVRSRAMRQGKTYADAPFGRVTWEATETPQDGRKAPNSSACVETASARQRADLGALR